MLLPAMDDESEVIVVRFDCINAEAALPRVDRVYGPFTTRSTFELEALVEGACPHEVVSREPCPVAGGTFHVMFGREKPRVFDGCEDDATVEGCDKFW